MVMSPQVRHGLLRVRTWQLWQEPGVLVSYLLTVVGVFVVVGVAQLASITPSLVNAAVYVTLLACAALCVEATRRLGETAGLSRAFQSSWTLPIALLLPPVYGLLAPVPLKALTQLRVGRSAVHRRVLTAAALGLAHFTASEVFHRLVAAGTLRATLVASPARTVLTAFGCVALDYLLNAVLVTTAVRLAAADVAWRKLLWDRESLYIDLAEMCGGVVVFAAWLLTPLLVSVLLPPALLLQRSLTYVQLRTAARTDAKTGLLNAVAWQQEAEREIVRATRDDHPLAVLMIDVDLFKGFNDTYGHLAGDQALATAAASLVRGLRVYDQPGRFGGEEFAVVLPNTDQNETRRVAERLRRAVAELVIPGVDPGARITISVGAAMLIRGTALIDLLAAADGALYRAKAGGRNQVAFAPGPPASPAAVPSARHPSGARRR
jgi:diguanylate cyclase (GGDEF)-like protein